MKTNNPYTFLSLIGIACCVWISPNEPAIKAPLYRETKVTPLAKVLNTIENQSIIKDTTSTASISIEEGGFRFAAW